MRNRGVPADIAMAQELVAGARRMDGAFFTSTCGFIGIEFLPFLNCLLSPPLIPSIRFFAMLEDLFLSRCSWGAHLQVTRPEFRDASGRGVSESLPFGDSLLLDTLLFVLSSFSVNPVCICGCVSAACVCTGNGTQ